MFRSRPSPFYVMDEVEAALDDVNLHRFLDLVAEFRPTAQLIIVSHQKRTMEAADVLYGVTMEPGGSSRRWSPRRRRHGARLSLDAGRSGQARLNQRSDNAAATPAARDPGTDERKVTSFGSSS